ncbi:DNA polymerase III subunit gamma/tau [Agromyces lapidis]|uniref:DNA polymerase III subunit gamma/tau n=1 Tax=Agromyces lapidis TaxID=279574 RepID=A0ABV5SP81_9MICO|nr:DNA polymerase III subunit gamma/tau [Agromyces lapidis]
MRPDPDADDDALRWEGDDDATLAPGWKAVGNPAPLKRGATSAPAAGDDRTGADVDAGDGAEVDDDGAAPAGAVQTGSVELVVLGVLGGVYLLYTIGWIITALRTATPGTSVVGDFMYGLGLWLAVLAAPLWFVLALRGARTARSRLVWLAVGVVVLAPLPFILGVTA